MFCCMSCIDIDMPSTLVGLVLAILSSLVCCVLLYIDKSAYKSNRSIGKSCQCQRCFIYEDSSTWGRVGLAVGNINWMCLLDFRNWIVKVGWFRFHVAFSSKPKPAGCSGVGGHLEPSSIGRAAKGEKKRFDLYAYLTLAVDLTRR